MSASLLEYFSLLFCSFVLFLLIFGTENRFVQVYVFVK